MISWYRRHLPTRIVRHMTLGHELAVVIVLKLIALMAIYYLFFSPAHRPAADTAAHLMGDTEIAQPPQSSGVK